MRKKNADEGELKDWVTKTRVSLRDMLAHSGHSKLCSNDFAGCPTTPGCPPQRIFSVKTKQVPRKLERMDHLGPALKGVRTAPLPYPKICHLSVGIIFVWKKPRPWGLIRNVFLSIKEFKLGALPIVRVITGNNFLWPVCRAGQSFNYRTSALLTVLPGTLLSPEAPRRLASGWAQDVTCPSCSLS